MNKQEIEFDQLSILPDSWEWLPLEEVIQNPKQDIVDGPFGSNLKASEYVNEGVAIARLQNIDRNEFVHKNIRFISAEKSRHLSRHNFKAGDILITKLGDPLGKACIVPSSIAGGIIVADLVRVRIGHKEIDSHYLMYALNSPFLARQFEKHTKGTTRPRVNLGIVRSLPIPVAPKNQQSRIVAEIEKQFSRLDEAVANLKRVKANLKRYKASVLKAAVEGRLVPTEAELASREGRSYETGGQLLHRTLDTRRSMWNGKLTMPAGPIVSDLPELPAGWIWVSAVQACDPVIDCHNKTAPYINDGIPLVRTTNIRDGRLVLEDLRYVDQPTYEYWSRRCPPQPGDVLFTREAPMGEAGIIPPGLQLCLGQRTMLMRPSLAISAGFLLASLMSPVVKGLIDRVAVGSGVKHLRVGDVERLPIPLPPLVEQHRIVAEVERLLSVIEELEAAVEANLIRANRLRQATLQKAFSGKLLLNGART